MTTPIARSVLSPMLLQFLPTNRKVSMASCLRYAKDGKHGASVEAFQYLVRRVLVAISDMDPNGERSARKRYVGDRARTPSSPAFHLRDDLRAVLPADAQPLLRSVVVLRPVEVEHPSSAPTYPRDTPKTEWDQTVRDRIRVAPAAGRYFIPDSTSYAASEHIVKPLDDDGRTSCAGTVAIAIGARGRRKRRNGKEEGQSRIVI